MNIRRTFIKLSEADKGKLSFMKNPWEAGKQAGTSTFYSDRKSAHLAFVDSSGQSHVLQDQEILGTQTSQRTTIDGVVRYAASYNWYRSRNDQGKVYRSVEDNGMIFYADAAITVPFIPQQRDWDDHDSEALDKPILPSGNLYTRDGTLMRIDGGYVSWLRDRNGNALRFYYEAMPGSGTNLKRVIRITDSLNRDINIQYGDYSQPDTINYGGFGTTRTIKVQRTRLNVALQDGDFLRTLLQVYPEADFLLHNITELYSPEVFSGIEFPDGRTYTFKYNALAQPTKVTKPDGSVTTYEYAGGTVNLNAAYKGGALTFRLCDPAYQIPDGFGGTQMEVN